MWGNKMIKAIVFKLLIKLGGSILFDLIEAALKAIKDDTKTKLDDNAYNLITADKEASIEVLNKNIKTIVELAK